MSQAMLNKHMTSRKKKQCTEVQNIEIFFINKKQCQFFVFTLYQSSSNSVFIPV